LLFSRGNTVTGAELIKLDQLLVELGGDSTEFFLRTHYLVNLCGADLMGLSAVMVEDVLIHLYCGDSFLDLRRAAAYELFELYYPEEYAVWQKSYCDGLNFDTDRFLDSACWTVEEIQFGDKKHLIIVGQ